MEHITGCQWNTFQAQAGTPMDNNPLAMDPLRQRISSRLAATGKAARRASLDGGLSEYAISKILSKPEHSVTLETVEKLARGLETTPLWLAYGVGDERALTDLSADGTRLTVNVDLLRQALLFVLENEGVGAERAAIIADILPEALSGPPVEAVKRDPFLSFQIRLELGSDQSERSTHR